MRTILFVCTGNTCRSPMAEAIARQALNDDPSLAGTDQNQDSRVFIASAGVSAMDGMPTTAETVEALRRRGIEFEGTSKKLTGQMIRKASLVVAMTAAHRDAARALVEDDDGRSGDQSAKIVLLDPDGDIEDPIGLGQGEYDSLADRMTRLIPKRLASLLRGQSASDPPPDSSPLSSSPPSSSPPGPPASSARRERRT